MQCNCVFSFMDMLEHKVSLQVVYMAWCKGRIHPWFFPIENCIYGMVQG